MQRIKKAYAENGDLKIIPETPPLDGSENWEQGRGAYYELDNDPNTGDPLALDIDREQDNYFKNVISKNIKHWQENSYPNWFNDIEYPKNATVKYTDGNIYASKIDNNTSLPTDTNNWTIYDPSSFDSKFVKTTENQTIAGIKTFTSSPIVPTPTASTQAANKAYVDTKQANLGFTPVAQGTGIGQLNNLVQIGWSYGDRVKITVDTTDIGNVVMDSNIGVANSSLVKTALNASGGAPIYACRAWVNFNGTGTVAIRASGNVSSITDNGVGHYTVNFATAMPDSKYSEIVGSGLAAEPLVNFARAFCTGSRLSSAISVVISDNNGDIPFDMEVVNVSIFR